MIITLPATDHDHLADALVRDLGFTRVHVDQPLRDLLLELDPFVDGGVSMANMGAGPRLSARLEQVGGRNAEDRWSRLLNPPRRGSKQDQIAAEVKRLLEVLRSTFADYGLDTRSEPTGDAVIVGSVLPTVAIEGRFGEFGARLAVEKWIEPAGVVGEQQAIVAYVQELRTAPPTVVEFEDALRKPLDEPMFESLPAELREKAKQEGLIYDPPTDAEHAEVLAAIVPGPDVEPDPPADDALATTLKLVEQAHEKDPA